MSFSRWLRNLQSASRLGRATGSGRLAARPRPAARCRPQLEALEARTVPSTLTVTSALDDGSSGTLRSAITAAASGDTIRFSNQLHGHTITLTGGQLAITKNLDIEGPGANKVTVSGNNASRVFKISGAGTTVTIAGLTIADGRVVADGGGGIRNDGGTTLTLRQDTLANNTAYGIGGGLWNNGGALAVVGSTFLGNQAIGFVGFFGPGNGTSEGGGIDNDGTATITTSTFTNNLALGTGGGTSSGAHGGGIGDDGPLTVTGCTFTGNQAVGAPVINGTTLSSQGLGGGILSEAATVNVSDSTFRDNVARGGDGATSIPFPNSFIGVGGGIASFLAPGDPTPSVLTVTNCTLDHNQAIGGAGGPGGAGGLALGGGLEVSRSSLTVSGSSFSHNAAEGGAGGSGAVGGDASGGGLGVDILSTANLSNITVAHNQAIGGDGGTGANGGNGYGGGLSVASRMLLGRTDDFTAVTLSGSTVTDNDADGGHAGNGGSGGSGSGGGVFIGTSGSLSVTASSVTVNHADGGGGSGGLGVGGGVYNLGAFGFDLVTAITGNHASTSNDDIFP